MLTAAALVQLQVAEGPAMHAGQQGGNSQQQPPTAAPSSSDAFKALVLERLTQQEAIVTAHAAQLAKVEHTVSAQAAEIAHLKAENAYLMAENADLKAENADLNIKVADMGEQMWRLKLIAAASEPLVAQSRKIGLCCFLECFRVEIVRESGLGAE